MIIGLIVIYVVVFIGLLISANQHGKPKEGNHDFWVNLISHAISMTLIWWALGWRFI